MITENHDHYYFFNKLLNSDFIKEMWFFPIYSYSYINEPLEPPRRFYQYPFVTINRIEIKKTPKYIIDYLNDYTEDFSDLEFRPYKDNNVGLDVGFFDESAHSESIPVEEISISIQAFDIYHLLKFRDDFNLKFNFDSLIKESNKEIAKYQGLVDSFKHVVKYVENNRR